MTKIKDVIAVLEKLAPPSLQENYDNAGLITGDANAVVKGALICLDSTEEVIEEAIKENCNLVIAHHPIIFSGLKKITGKSYVERTIIKAIKNDIAIYALHTNLDNVSNGVNKAIIDKLGLVNQSILSPKNNLLRKLVTFVPFEHAGKVRNALFEANAGSIGNYNQCSFNVEGTGTFQALTGANPYVGSLNQPHTEKEVRVEVIYEAFKEEIVLKNLSASHPYEEVAYDIYPLTNSHKTTGSGMIGELINDVSEQDFFTMLKINMELKIIKHTRLLGKQVKRVAVCGGAGIFLLPEAIRQNADVFITSDVKYHEFFDADGRIVLADIGHYESEQFTGQLIMNELNNNFSTFALRLTKVNTNPVNYL